MRSIPYLLALVHVALFVGMLAPLPVQPYPGPKVPGEFSFSSWHMATGIMVAGRDLHHNNMAKFLFLADLPIHPLVLLIALAAAPLPGELHPVTASYVGAGLWLVLGSLWWFVIGKWLLFAMARRLTKRCT